MVRSFLLFFSVAHAAFKIACLVPLLKTVDPTHDTAVEMELPTTDRVMGLLTTLDGTLAPIFSNEQMPTRTKEWIEQHQPTYASSPASCPWELLPPEEQRNLIAESGKNQSFGRDRKIHGLKIKEQVRVHFFRPTTFLGKEYPAGWHMIDTKGLFMPYVEYSGPNTITTGEGIEIHFRVKEQAGAAQADSWKFLRGLHIPVVGEHVHMVAPLPVERLKSNPKLEAYRTADYIRRGELVAQLVSSLEGGQVKTVQEGSVTYFKGHAGIEFDIARDYFLAIGKGEPGGLGNILKMGWIGIHDSEKYDEPSLWGLQYRPIDGESHPKLQQAILNALQQSMIQDDMGIPADQFEKWTKTNNPKAADLAPFWYDSVEDQRPFSGELENYLASDAFHNQVRENHLFNVLRHDWSNDIIFYDKKRESENVKAWQDQTLKNMKDHPGEEEEYLREFIIKSGLLANAAKTIGVGGIDKALEKVGPPYIVDKDNK